jgi:hypothetical protein
VSGLDFQLQVSVVRVDGVGFIVDILRIEVYSEGVVGCGLRVGGWGFGGRTVCRC